MRTRRETHIHNKTFRRHMAWGITRGPVMALSAQLASFIAIRSLGATDEQAILIFAALPAGNLLGLVWSRIMARRSRIPFLFWADVLAAVVLCLIAAVDSSEVFIGILIATIMMRSAGVTAFSGIIRENYHPQIRGYTVGRVQAWGLGAVAVAGWIFGRILEVNHDAYRFLYPIASVLAIAGAVRMRSVPEMDPRSRQFTREPSWFDLVHVLGRNRDFLFFEASFFAFGFGAIMFNSLLPIYLAKDLRVNYEEASVALAVISPVLLCLTSGMWGKLIDRFNILRLRGVFNLIWATVPLIVFLTGSVWGVYLGQFLAGLIQGGSMLVWMLASNIFAPRDEVPIYMGIHQFLTGVRGLIAPFAGIFLASLFQGSREVPAYDRVFLLCFLVMTAAGAFMLWEAGEMERQGKATTFELAEREERERSPVS